MSLAHSNLPATARPAPDTPSSGNDVWLGLAQSMTGQDQFDPRLSWTIRENPRARRITTIAIGHTSDPTIDLKHVATDLGITRTSQTTLPNGQVHITGQGDTPDGGRWRLILTHTPDPTHPTTTRRTRRPPTTQTTQHGTPRRARLTTKAIPFGDGQAAARTERLRLRATRLTELRERGLRVCSTERHPHPDQPGHYYIIDNLRHTARP